MEGEEEGEEGEEEEEEEQEEPKQGGELQKGLIGCLWLFCCYRGRFVSQLVICYCTAFGWH